MSQFLLGMICALPAWPVLFIFVLLALSPLIHASQIYQEEGGDE